MASNRLWGNKQEKTVILDSNAIMMPFEFSIDLEKELTGLLGKYHIIIPLSIVRELEFLSKHGRGKKRIIAKASLKLISKYDTMNIDEHKGDDAVFCLAKKLNGIVVTNDKELKKRLKEISIPVVFLRAKKKLMLG